MQTTLRRASRLIGIAAVALIPVLGAVTTAQAATSVTYDLQSSAVGQTANSTINASVTGSAPSTVAAGGSLAISLTVGSITVPTSASGYTIKDIQGIDLKIPVPANSTYVSSSLAGGSNYGSGTPSVSESNGVVDIAIPGPIAGGATFTLPTLTLNLTAGSSGSTITSTLAGTSYSNPGLTFTAVISVIGISVNASSVGYPTTSPVFTTTTVS
jgi:dehydratase